MSGCRNPDLLNIIRDRNLRRRICLGRNPFIFVVLCTLADRESIRQLLAAPSAIRCDSILDSDSSVFSLIFCRMAVWEVYRTTVTGMGIVWGATE